MIFDYHDDIVTLLSDDESNKVTIKDESVIVEVQEYLDEMVKLNHLGDTDVEPYQATIGNVHLFFVNGILKFTDLNEQENNSVFLELEDDFENIPNCFLMVAQDIVGGEQTSMFELFRNKDIEDAEIIEEEA